METKVYVWTYEQQELIAYRMGTTIATMRKNMRDMCIRENAKAIFESKPRSK